PPFSAEEAPEIIGVAVTFHYINRMVHVFLDESPLPINLGSAQGLMKRMAGGMMKHLRRPPQPGDSLQFRPEAELPDDMGWAAGNENVARAWAGVTAVMETAGRTSLSQTVRTLVQERLQTWQGEEMGMNRRWVDEAVAGLDEADKPAGRLALLTAFASYQVGEKDIKAFCAQQSGDDKLIAATAWAGFAAARRIGCRLGYPFRNPQLK
ncbi:MAG: hypothetical protein KC419_11235, partial [Anaerolineales bacterium]|nr:hypothetical protein [Anaerolineales bacterium]